MKKLFLFFAICLFLSTTSKAQNSKNEAISSDPIQETTLVDSTELTFDTPIQNPKPSALEEAPVKPTAHPPIIPNQGFSLNSLWRGILGMISLIFISFLFSSNRKAINWKIVGIGLAFQLLIAIGVLKVEVIKAAFEFIGGLFVSVLDFTRAGSKFLFEGLVVDMDTFGFIFAFQVLPTIIFLFRTYLRSYFISE